MVAMIVAGVSALAGLWVLALWFGLLGAVVAAGVLVWSWWLAVLWAAGGGGRARANGALGGGLVREWRR